MQPRKAAIGFIFVTLLIDVTGWGIIIPVMPELLHELTGLPISETSKYNGWLILAFSIPQFLFSPMVGNLSDRFGRRPVLLLAMLGFGIDYLFMAFAPTLWLLFIGRAIAGFTGASFTTASAYIADISNDQNRAQNFGMIGAAFGAGFVLGPLIGGLLGTLGTRVPFIAAAALCLLNCLWGYFILPESLSKENRRKFEWKRANPFTSLFHLKKYRGIGELVLSFALLYIGAHAVQSNWNFFTAERFGWSQKLIGFSLAAVGILVGAVQAGLTRVLNPRLGNEKSIYLGMSLYTLGMFLFAVASSTWMMFVFLIPYCLGGIAGPALQSVIVKHVPANEQGALQGALTSLMSLTSIIGPFIMTNLFAYSISERSPVYFPGAPFVLGGLFMLASTITIYHALGKEKQKAIV